ncbi:hypothetical protein DFH94DRAFT_684444 [Russula ochroleuca]|uniref:Uncharacterized protein n=1 Tax=Russula ochroleuca TaxID=152965 RepID=A0A9P5JZ14_9AGAM|nr:hypothetical protein DFH94DRAFT_684444 [Russula ochroleuca]
MSMSGQLATLFILLALIFTLSAYFKRRNERATLVKIKQTQRGSEAAYGSNPHDSDSAGGETPFAPPQYPPLAYNDFNKTYTYDPTKGFAPPSVPPPQYYPPPPGVPPITSDQK